MPIARVPPERYREFAAFAEALDSAEARIAEVVLK
jgi:hypothetical protein